MRLGPWVQSEAPRLSLGRGGEPRAHSVPRSRIFPRPHSSDIADTTLPHALTLLLLGYSSETWWQSRLASSTRRFAQVRARPCHRSPPRRHARAPLSGETHSRANSRTQTNARARRSRNRNAAPQRALTRRPSRWLTHWPLCRRRLAFLVRLSYFEGGADRCTRQCRCRLDVSSIQRATLARWESIASSQRGVSTRGTQRQCAGTATGATVTTYNLEKVLVLKYERTKSRDSTPHGVPLRVCVRVSPCVY